MYFESHAHYDDKRYNKDREQLLASLPAEDVGIVVNAGTTVKTSKIGIDLAEEYSYFYTAVGVHPHNADTLTEDGIRMLGEMSNHPKVVAIGEIGLDFHYDFSPRDLQRKWFIRQLQLAKELHLPVIIHAREASEETFKTISQYADPQNGGVIHCFSGSAELAKQYVALGYYIGVGGVVTYSNAKKLVQVVKEIPLSAIVIETDCPYLAPDPNRGKRNDSRNLCYIAQKIAEIKNETVETVAKTTYDNGCELFITQVKK